MKRFCKTVALSLGLALPGAGLYAVEASIPWEQIDTGLTRLAGGDGVGAGTSFEAARSSDPSHLAGLLGELTAAYVADDPRVSPESTIHSRRDRDLLDIARRDFHRQPVPPAVLNEALTRIRRLLKQAPAQGPYLSYLRPLLCNLRLLSGDRSTDGEPVLEAGGKSGDMGPLAHPTPQFTPSPHLTPAAKADRAGDTLVIDVELVLDSEGCPTSEKLIQPLPDALVKQTLASLSWWAYEPARYDGYAVGWKLPVSLNVRFVAGAPSVP
jgi:hypothetical protein